MGFLGLGGTGVWIKYDGEAATCHESRLLQEGRSFLSVVIVVADFMNNVHHKCQKAN